MGKAITITRRTIAFILLLIIGASLIAYFFYPSSKPSAPTYAYMLTIYDVFGNKTGVIAKNITVTLQGITFPDYNVTFKSPNQGNSSYFFSDLKAGYYSLKIQSQYNILLYNKTIYIDKDKTETLVLPSQPLTIQLFVNGKPSKISYDISLMNLNRNFTLNATISSTNATYTFSELPLGSYKLKLYYLALQVNETQFELSGSTSILTLNTRLLNATFLLKASNKNILNETSLYLEYEGKTIGPYTSSKNGTIFVNNIPPLKFKVVFNYKGINVTTDENAVIDFSSVTQRSFNFTTHLANLTLIAKYDNGAPAKGIGVFISSFIKGTLGNEGNITIKNIPANVNLNIKLNSSSLIIFSKNITLEPNKNNTVDLIISRYNLKINLKGYSDITNFNIYFVVENVFNKTSLQFKATNLNIDLYPSVYRLYVFVKTPSGGSLLIYREAFGLNSTFEKTVNVPLGYQIIVRTNSTDDIIQLYYVDQSGEYKIGEAKGNQATFNNLVLGIYKIVVLRNGEYLASSSVVINQDSPSQVYININTAKSPSIINFIQSSVLLLTILLIIVTFLSYLIYRNYQIRKEK